MSISNLPPGFKKINFENQINKAYKNIPFAPEESSYCVILRSDFAPPLDDSPIWNALREAWPEEEPKQRRRARRRFIEHYFPEYYPFLLDDTDLTSDEQKVIAWHKQDYLDLKQQIEDSLSIRRKIYVLPPLKHKIIWETTLDLPRLRQEMLANIDAREQEAADPDTSGLDFSFVLEILNRKLERGTEDSTTTIKFQNVPQVNKDLSTLFPGLATLTQGTAVTKATNTNNLQIGITRIINKITESIHDTIDFAALSSPDLLSEETDEAPPTSSAGPPSAYSTDYFTIYFDDKTRIVKIDYLVFEETFGSSEPSIIGYITNIKYRPLYKDPATLLLLKTHQDLLDFSQENQLLGQQPPWSQFFAQLGISGDSLGFGLSPGAPFTADGPSQYSPRNSDTYVDISDYESLERAFKDAEGRIGMDDDELARLQEMESDPIFQAKMLQLQKARHVNTDLSILDDITTVLNADYFNIMNKTPAGRKVNRVLGAFGVQALAKEAVICLTFGVTVSAGRMTTAMRNALLQESISLGSPLPPEHMTRPNLGIVFENLKPKNYFSVTGSPPVSRKIQDVFLNALAQGGLEIIKGLAEMFKIGCSDMLDNIFGAVDVGSELKRRNLEANVTFPDLTLSLENTAEALNLSLDEVYEYYSQVSAILTPIEVCRLLNSQGEVTDTTVEKILEFNENYLLEAVALGLNSRTAILAHFGQMTGYIDTVSFCNDIINENIVRVVSDCKICPVDELPPDDPMVPVIEELVNIAENGIQPPMPPMPDLLCPESVNYIESPVAARLIPNLMNSIVDTAKIYMAGSLESARTKLLDPVVDPEVDPEFEAAATAANVTLPEASVDPAALQFITSFLNVLQDLGADFFPETAQNCPDIQSSAWKRVIENKDLALSAWSAAGDEIPGIIEETAAKVDSLTARLLAGDENVAQVPVTRYVFPSLFKEDFENAIKPTIMIHNDVASYEVFVGHPEPKSINTTYASFHLDTGLYQGSSIGFNFDNQNSINISYAPYAPNSATPFVQLDWDLPSLDNVGTTASSSSLDQDLLLVQASSSVTGATNFGVDLELIDDQTYQMSALNPYIHRYTHNISGYPVPPSILASRVGIDYPAAYGYLTWAIYDYISRNGAFQADGPRGINNLRLFKNNKTCTPENIGDLFDADGIIDQMKKEFVSASCYDRSPAQPALRGVLYFGLLNMLIQTIIDEFIVSNIIVFSALNIGDILDPRRPFRNIVINYVVSSFERMLAKGDTTIQRELYNYFDLLSDRAAGTPQRGITHSYAPDEVVPGFEAPYSPLNNAEMIKFMVEERLGYTWDQDGTSRSTIKAIQNIIDPENTNKLFEDIFLEDVIGVYDDLTAGLTEVAARTARQGGAASALGVTLIITTSPDPVIKIWEIDNLATQWRVLAEFAYDPQSLADRQAKLDFIKEQPEYKLLFSQALDMNTCLMVPIFHNLFLTNKYFADVGSSFETTKRAIIEMFNMIDQTSYPPQPSPRNEEFSNALANNGGQDLGSMARDVFLKFLAETPAQILKGLAELIDPHVSLSKIIRDLTGASFNAITAAIQKQIDNAPTSSQLGQLKAAGVTAHDIFSVVVCIYNTSTSIPVAMGEMEGSGLPLFLPRVSATKGIDFAGSISGMLMMPPKEFGIVYILIELLKSLIESALEGAPPEDSSLPSPNDNSAEEDCPEGTISLDTAYTPTE